MELIHKSQFLTIHLDDGIMIQQWTTYPLNETNFKQELKNFLQKFKTIKPRGALWDLENLELEISEDLYNWVEKNILKPLYKAGLRKLPTTVPKEKFIYLSIINSVQKVGLVLKPHFFTCRKKALEYINDPVNAEQQSVNYHVNQTENTSEIVLDLGYEQLPEVLKQLEKLNIQLKFNETNQDNFHLLSFREIEIFKNITQGKSNKEIADKLFLSENTIATHRKSIIKKLNIKSTKDWQRYADAFL